MQRIQISSEDIADKERLRQRLDMAYQQNYELLSKYTLLEQRMAILAGTSGGSSALSDDDRTLLRQLAIGSTASAAPAQNALEPKVDALPPASVSVDGQVVVLSTDGLRYRFDGSTQSWVATSNTPHNMLSGTHPDTTPGTVVRGDLITGDGTPKWVRMAIGTAFQQLRVNAGGTDLEYGAVDDSMLSANVTLLKSSDTRTAQSADLAFTTIYTTPTPAALGYMISLYVYTSTIGAAGDRTTFQIRHTDPVGVKTFTDATFLDLSASNYRTIVLFLKAANVTAIQIGTTAGVYAGGGKWASVAAVVAI